MSTKQLLKNLNGARKTLMLAAVRIRKALDKLTSAKSEEAVVQQLDRLKRGQALVTETATKIGPNVEALATEVRQNIKAAAEAKAAAKAKKDALKPPKPAKVEKKVAKAQKKVRKAEQKVADATKKLASVRQAAAGWPYPDDGGRKTTTVAAAPALPAVSLTATAKGSKVEAAPLPIAPAPKAAPAKRQR